MYLTINDTTCDSFEIHLHFSPRGDWVKIKATNFFFNINQNLAAKMCEFWWSEQFSSLFLTWKAVMAVSRIYLFLQKWSVQLLKIKLFLLPHHRAHQAEHFEYNWSFVDQKMAKIMLKTRTLNCEMWWKGLFPEFWSFM